MASIEQYKKQLENASRMLVEHKEIAKAQKSARNERGQARPANQPYEVWTSGQETFQVLKCYQSAANEAKNEYARRLVAYEGPGETDRAGHDMYLKDLKRRARLVWTDDGSTMPTQYTI